MHLRIGYALRPPGAHKANVRDQKAYPSEKPKNSNSLYHQYGDIATAEGSYTLTK